MRNIRCQLVALQHAEVGIYIQEEELNNTKQIRRYYSITHQS